MTKPRIALVIGIICISIFPILVKLKLSPPIISTFYRMAIAATVLVPLAVISGKFEIPSVKLLMLTIICGTVFGLLQILALFLYAVGYSNFSNSFSKSDKSNFKAPSLPFS